MSARPIEAKQRRRAAKALRRQPLVAYFDLVQWLIDHKHAKSRKQAREVILAHRVTANSHPVGWEKVQVIETETQKLVEKDVVVKHVPVKLKRDLVVAAA